MTDELLVAPHKRLLRESGIGRAETWTLNRPHVRNALSPSLVNALHDALLAAERSGVQVVILRGNGASFCAGADLGYLQTHEATAGETPRQFLSSIWELTIAMEHSSIVFVAALHGHAVAGGLELALACDVVLADEETLIGDGHVSRNLLAGGGASARLERSLGRSTAFWLALTGSLLPARDPAFSGWIRRTAPADQFDAVVEAVAEQLLRIPAAAQQGYKRVLQAQVPPPTHTDRDRELNAFDRHWVEQNVPEALRLFLDKNRKVS